MEVKTEKSNEKLPILITKNKDTQSLLGLNWVDRLEIGLPGRKNTIIFRNIANDERREKIIGEFEDLIKNNHTINDLTIDIQLKKRKKLIETGHLEKTDKTTENCFVSLAVITIKEDKIGQKSSRLTEAEQCLYQKKSDHAEYGRTD